MFKPKKYIDSLFQAEWDKRHADYINKNWDVEHVVRKIIDQEAKGILEKAMAGVLDNVNNSRYLYDGERITPQFQAAFIEHLVQAVNKVQLNK